MAFQLDARQPNGIGSPSGGQDSSNSPRSIALCGESIKILRVSGAWRGVAGPQIGDEHRCVEIAEKFPVPGFGSSMSGAELMERVEPPSSGPCVMRLFSQGVGQ